MSSVDTSFQALQTELEQQIAAALTRRAKSNRGTFPPFRIPATARSLAAGLLAYASDPIVESARSLGQSLGQQGLSLLSLLEAQAATFLAAAEKLTGTPGAIDVIGGYFANVIDSLVATDQAEMVQQRAEMERAYMSTVTAQRVEQDHLRSTIRELSTPIIPVYEGILVLPLVGAIDSRRATEITERLLEEIATQQAEIVIIDITGVSLIDTSTANHLLMTTRAASLLGSQVVLVGMGAEIAQTIVQLGVELHGLITLADLQAGIAYALKRFGLGIQPLQA
jgi:rsbT co-antagonist protein RsbR